MRVSRVSVAAIAAFLSALLVCAPPLAAQEKDLNEKIRGKESELDAMRKAIAEQRTKIRQVEREERDVEEYLQKLKEEDDLARKLLDGLAERESLLEMQVQRARRELEMNEEVYRHRLGVLAMRLREMYKEGPRRMWQELLNARDIADLFQRYTFLSMIAERDASLVSDVRRRGAQIEVQEANLTALLHEVSVGRAEKEREVALLEENQEKRERTLSDLKKQKGRYQKKIDELARAERQLQELIAELERQRLEAAKDWSEYGEGDFLSLKGKMPRPVEGRVVRPFGTSKHPEFGTVTFNSGLDIEARSGSPVRAVARGKVEYASTLPGYGNCIIVNHGGGYYTLYAHASRILAKQGELVETGRVIAETGGGSAGGAAPLHFEIRRSKEALDPGAWLAK